MLGDHVLPPSPGEDLVVEGALKCVEVVAVFERPLDLPRHGAPVVGVEQGRLADVRVDEDFPRDLDVAHHRRGADRQRFGEGEGHAALGEARVHRKVGELVEGGELLLAEVGEAQHVTLEPMLLDEVLHGRIASVPRQHELVADMAVPEQVLIGAQQRDHVLRRTELAGVEDEVELDPGEVLASARPGELLQRFPCEIAAEAADAASSSSMPLTVTYCVEGAWCVWYDTHPSGRNAHMLDQDLPLDPLAVGDEVLSARDGLAHLAGDQRRGEGSFGEGDGELAEDEVREGHQLRRADLVEIR